MNQGDWIDDNPDIPRIRAWRAETDADECELLEPAYKRDLRFWMSARRGARELAKLLSDAARKSACRENLAAYTVQARRKLAAIKTLNLSHMDANARKGR
jgi:hypothetical protein